MGTPSNRAARTWKSSSTSRSPRGVSSTSSKVRPAGGASVPTTSTLETTRATCSAIAEVPGDQITRNVTRILVDLAGLRRFRCDQEDPRLAPAFRAPVNGLTIDVDDAAGLRL